MARLLALALFAIAVMTALAGRAPVGDAPASEAAKPAPRSSPRTDALVLDRDGSGQFHLTAQVNGSPRAFLVDTGADVVALTAQDAADLGVLPPSEDFQPVMQTASGVGYGARVTLDELEIDGTRFSEVEAVVVQGLSTNLLGQNVLRRLGKVELRGDRMVIHH